MTGPRNQTTRALFLKFMADCQLRVSQQKQLIACLKRQGAPTTGAEADLMREEASLRQLENHAALMQNLLQPDRYRS